MLKEDDMVHYAQLNDQDLPKGHLDRFIKKLDSALHRNRKILKFQIYAVAASVITVVGLSFLLFIKVTQFREHPPLLAGISPELEETELYYQSQIQESMKELTTNNLIDKEVISDFKEIDKSFRLINKDLQENPGDERIINMVIQIYQIKLDLINELLLQLK